MSPDGTYTISELADLIAVTPRTVRYYVAQGLLKSPTGAGGGARYDEDHLRRLRLIRRLQGDHLPLAEIRRRIEAMTPDEVEAAISSEPDAVTESALAYLDRVLPTPEPLARAYQLRAIAASAPGPEPLPSEPLPSDAQRITFPLASLPGPSPTPARRTTADRSQWDRISLDPDIELHIRRPQSRTQSKKVERLIELARQILEEEQP